MSCHLIDAESLTAWYVSRPRGGGILTIEAKGHCECPNLARITQAPMPIEPPEFNLESCDCPAIGMFPYDVKGSFAVGYTPTVVVNTASGSKTVQVKPVPAVAGATAVPAPQPEASNEATGYAPNSTDVNLALSNAVSALRKKYPTNINATVKEIGFFAVGSPVGIAATFVTLEQLES
jgi:hypothetical protein